MKEAGADSSRPRNSGEVYDEKLCVDNDVISGVESARFRNDSGVISKNPKSKPLPRQLIDFHCAAGRR